MYTITIEKTKFPSIKGHITGKSFLEALQFELIILRQMKWFYIQKSNFDRFTEVDEVFRKMMNYEILSEEQWDKLCETIQ